MTRTTLGPTAIVDYGMGNLFSVKQACEHVGLPAVITTSRDEIQTAAAVILPGVGAFSDAMRTLSQLDLVKTLQEIGASEKPLIGICLGMQLLMTVSNEFGRHQGLNIIRGEVVQLTSANESSPLKVPQIGWNRIYANCSDDCGATTSLSEPTWNSALLQGTDNGEFMYFVHSYYTIPEDKQVVTSISKYGSIEFCSSLSYRNVFACQFHPERSGPSGLKIYRNLARIIQNNEARNPDAHEPEGKVRSS